MSRPPTRTLTPRIRTVAALTAFLTLIGLVAAATPPAEAVPAISGDVTVHDPTLQKVGDCYYVFSTGVDPNYRGGSPTIRRSCTGLQGPWQVIGAILDGAPQWMTERLGGRPATLWAPDVEFVNGLWHAYYSGSFFGGNNSAIGLATAASIEGPYTDRGEVIATKPGVDNHNAIDSDVVWERDATGQKVQAWMTWGSWERGIRIARLGADGKLVPGQQYVTIADRPNNGGIEAPTISYRGGYYYLFVSFDLCCRGSDSNYRVMVGRSTSITGPYLDQSGVDMRNGGGTQLIASYGNVRGPGHQDVFDDAGTFRLIHHWYDSTNNGAYTFDVRDLAWTSSGWPTLLGPSPNLGGTGTTVTNAHNGLCLDDWEWNTTPGAAVRQYTCGTAAVQQWYVSAAGTSAGGYVQIVNRHSGLCLDNWLLNSQPGAEVRQFTCNGGDNQDWVLRDVGQGYYEIKNRFSGLCLDNWEWATAPGSEVRLYTCLGNAAQRWKI